MKKIILIGLLFTAASSLFAQHHLSGTVTDIHHEPILGVQVYIENLHIGTTTDENGFFELKNVPDNLFEITFEFLGFETVKKRVKMNGKDQNIQITLKESVFHMDEVIVSTPFHKVQRENVMKVNFKKIGLLSQRGALTLIQSMTSIPGVEDYATGISIGKPVIRGLTGNRVLVYTQGIRLENQQFGGEHGLGLVGSGFESLEVIKGPASLLYGSDALGGVLYFNPEKFAMENNDELNINQRFFSNTLGSSTSAGYKNSFHKMKYLIRATLNTHSDYKIPDGNRVTNTRFNEKDFKAGMGWNTDQWASEIRYNFTRSNLGLTEGIEEQSTSKTMQLPKQLIDNHILSFHNHYFIGKSKLDIDLGYVFNNRKEFEDSFDEPVLNLKLGTFSYNAKYHVPEIKNVELIVGLQGMIQRNTNAGEEILIPDARTNDVGILSTMRWTINELSAFQAGIRFDHRSIKTEEHLVFDDEGNEKVFEPISRSFQNITASAGYKIEFWDALITRINLASGFRAPNLAELTSNGVHEGTFRYEIGNPDLDSERNFQTDLSIEYKSNHIEVYANGFYNNIRNYIFIEPSGETINDYPVYRYKQNSADLYGGEFGFHFHPHPIDWLHLESGYEMVFGRQQNGNDLPLIPPNKWTNTIRTEFDRIGAFKEVYFELKSNYYFKQDRVSEFETPTEAYNLLHLGAGSQFKIKTLRFGLFFNINNLLNTTYTAHLSALKNEGIPNMGRNFILGVNFKW